MHGSTFDLAVRYRQAQDAGLTEDKIAALPRYLTDSAFSAKDRACIAYAEQFAIDSSSIDDALVDAVLVHLDDGELFAFTNAVSMWDAVQRAFLTLDVQPPASDLTVIGSLRLQDAEA
jgi:alkylhydroperoxidase family enzyme